MDRVTDIATLLLGVVLPFVAFIALLLVLRWLMGRFQARHTGTQAHEDEAQTYPALPVLPSEPVALWDAHRWAARTRNAAPDDKGAA